MASFPTPQQYIFNDFKGIRTRNGVVANGVISATVCKNIDFVPSSYDASINIATTKGNYTICAYTDYTVIKGFETEQEGTKHLLLYVENDTKGKLVEYNFLSDDFTTLIDNLTLTGQANGITLKHQAYDVFVFTNGIEYYAIQFYPTPTVTTQLHPEYDGNDLTGLAMCEYYGSVVIGGDNGVVLASSRTDITDFDTTGGLDTSAWAETFGKAVTAVVPYIDSILVFTADDSTVLSGYQTIATREREDASLGGCYSFESWCNHDKYLFFYDDKQKNIYYYMQNNFGQKVLGEPIAPEVQKYFNNLQKLQMVSYIGKNRSEIWLLSDNFKLIYDYYVGEWTERNCQELTSYFVFDNDVYSTSEAKVLKEKEGNICLFDNVYYPAEYTTQIINLGSFSNAKEMDIYPLLSVTQDYNNSFYFDCLVDGKKEKSKHVEMFFQGAIWADDTPQTENTPDNELWDLQTFPAENSSHIQQVKGKIIPFWYYIQFSFKTKERGEDFSISCFEIKGITQEYDTIGRK